MDGWHAECREKGEIEAKPETTDPADWTEWGDSVATRATFVRTLTLAGKTIGLTTGQAARYCLVSPDTIAKWIKDDQLRAQRTMGGQYRIFVDDLRQFMVANDMSTDLLDEELDHRPFCWQHRQHLGETDAVPEPPCIDCPAYRARAMDCFELRAMDVAGPWDPAGCAGCAYHKKWAHPSEAAGPVNPRRADSAEGGG
ncbi:MAG: excisionase family DNA-binding protein [Phycisphaerae bacterium]|nr:excisionase family DNA-binding protein [Phycisphaerae bacterium]